MLGILLSIIQETDCLQAYGWIGLLISAAITGAAAGINARQQRKASNEQKRHNEETQKRIDAKSAQENAWYRMQYYKDPLRSNSGAHMLAAIRDYNKSMLERTRNRNVITGGTHESEVAMSDVAARRYAQAAGDIKAADDRQKLTIGQYWQQAEAANFQRQLNLDDLVSAERMQGYMNTATNVNNFANVATQAVSSGMEMGAAKGAENATATNANVGATAIGEAPQLPYMMERSVGTQVGKAKVAAKPAEQTIKSYQFGETLKKPTEKYGGIGLDYENIIKGG